MASKETFQEIFERYVAVIWHAFVAVASGLGSFILKFVEVSGGFLRGVAYIIIASAIIIGVIVGSYGFVLRTVGIAESPTFQKYREAFLEKQLPIVLQRWEEHSEWRSKYRQEKSEPASKQPAPAQKEAEVK